MMISFIDISSTGEPTRDDRNEINCHRKCSLDALFPRGYWKEVKITMSLALPLFVTQASSCLNCSISLMFCGRLDKIHFDGAILANVLINALGLSLAIGLSTSCDTLFSQVYGSANKHKLGLVLIRSLVLLLLSAFIPISLFINSENILLCLGQEPEIAKLAARYLLIFSPGVIAFFIHVPLSKYLESQGIIRPSMIIGLLSNVINVVIHLILVTKMEYGLDGSSIAQASAHVAFLSLTVVYIILFKVYKLTWTGWSTECLLDWSQMLWLGWFGLIMTCIAWWSYEAGQILSGLLGTTEIAAQSVILQMSMYSFVIYMGLGIAVNIRVGQLLGNRDPEGAINSYRVVLTITCFIGLLFAVLVYGLRDFIPIIFTNIPEVVAMTSSALPWYAICCVFEGIVVTCCGIVRGAGLQNIGSLVTIVSYLIGLAVGIPLMLKSHSIQGFWKGIALALSTESVVLCVISVYTDWNKQANQALKRVDIATVTTLDTGNRVTTWIYVRTGIIIFLMLAILITGILVKVYVPTYVKETNLDYNSTQAYINL